MNITSKSRKGNKKTFKISAPVIYIPLAVLAVLFLCLPVIFPDDDVVARKPAAGAAAQQDMADEGPPLPVIVSRNPLAKIMKKISGFYGGLFGGKKKNANARNMYASSASVHGKTANSSQTRGPGGTIGPSYEASSYRAADGTPIKATMDGYYYGGKFYKNGAYPAPGLAKSIEAAVSRYHRAEAAKEGRAAAYVEDKKGNFVVEYLPKEYVDGYGSAGYARDNFDGMFATSGRYSGATVAQAGSSGYAGGSRVGGASSNGGAGYNKSVGDVPDLFGSYQSLAAKLNEIDLISSGRNQQDEQKPEQNGKEPEKIFTPSSDFEKDKFTEPSRPVNLPAYDPAKFDEAETFLGRGAKDLLVEFKIFEKGKLPQNPEIRELLSSNKPFKVFVDSYREEFFDYIKKNAKGDYYIGLRQEPYSTGKPEKFEDIFFKRTGLEDMLRHMQVPEEEIDRVRGDYAKLDETREKTSEYFKNLIKEHPELKDLRPKMLFILGKADSSEDVMVATPKSYLYAYMPLTVPDFVNEKLKQTGLAYAPVSRAEISPYVKKEGQVIVVTSDEDEKKAREFGARTVLNIPAEELSCKTPECIMKNYRKEFGPGMQAEITNSANAAQQRILDVKRKELIKARKVASEAGKTAKSIQTGAGTAKKTAVNQPPASKTAAPAQGAARGPLRVPDNGQPVNYVEKFLAPMKVDYGKPTGK